MYEFSIPMLYDKEIIDKIAKLNNNLKNSKIVTFYDALPTNSNFVTRLEQNRGINTKVNCLEEFLDYVKYVKDKGFKFVYLFNSTIGFNTNNVDKYKLFQKNLDILINSLNDIGCNTFRVGNTSIIQYLCEHYSNLEIIASTVFNYSSVLEYENLLTLYPDIKELCLNYENNHNFKLLKNLVKRFPDIKKELLVNELCIKGCPLRNSHFNFVMTKFSQKVLTEHNNCFKNNCTKMFYNNIWESICSSNIIYPWMIKKYSEYGLNSFKFVGREFNSTKSSFEYHINYLNALEDEEYMMNMNFFSLFYNPTTIMLKSKNLPDLKVKDVMEYLPDINHFVNFGQNCSSICKYECNYCYEKAKVLNEKFPLDKYVK